MVSVKLLSMEVVSESDLMAARQRTRQVAGLLKFEEQDITRIATAVSEIVRNALSYAGRGWVDFSFARQDGGRPYLEILVRDKGPGIADLQPALEGQGGGMGLIGARRLMDALEVDSAPKAGTRVHLRKFLPRDVEIPRGAALNALLDGLSALPVGDPLAESQRQNRELLASLAEIRRRQDDLVRLNRELEETNRGVVALYAELEEQAERLSQAHELKSRFLSNVSHEFRTPVNAILGLTRMLLERKDGELSEEQENQVNYIRQAADALADLVNDLLDLARIEAGKTKLAFEEFAAEEMFGTLRGMLKPMLTSDLVEFRVAHAGHLPLLHTDKGKLAQILRNLLSNAFKFTERGSVELSAEVMDDGATLLFQVTDTGIGIPPEHLERIFDEFSQVDSPLQAKSKGTGLGLSLSRRLAALLGGALSVESQPGRGSVFSLIIPCRHADIGVSRQRTVLIIDDDKVFRYLLSRSLPSSVEIVEVSNGEEGLVAVRSGKVDLIFLDVMMTGIDGYEVLRRLKADPLTRALPVVICTSLALNELERARLGEAAEILPKAAIAPESVSLVFSQLLE
jgi:signal transduction histidine kinase